MRTYTLHVDRVAGARHAVRQILLCWLIGTLGALAIWDKDVTGDTVSVLALVVIGGMAALPLWLMFRVFRFAFTR